MLWNRQYRVKFPDLNLEFANTLRISFDVTKDLSKETNKGKLVIYNLSDDTRKKIEVPDTKVEIYAGYKDNGGPVRLFVGSVISSSTKDDGRMSRQNSACPMARRLSVILRSRCRSVLARRATRSSSILRMRWACRSSSGTALSSARSRTATLSSVLPAMRWTVSATARGVKWSVQNEILQLILEGGTVSNKGLVFAPDSGLIGSPEHYTKTNSRPNAATAKRKQAQQENKDSSTAESGWKIRTLLSPTLNPGDLVKVESRYVTGWLKVKSAHHSGDTHSGDWASEIDLVDRNATLQSPESDAAGTTQSIVMRRAAARARSARMLTQDVRPSMRRRAAMSTMAAFTASRRLALTGRLSSRRNRRMASGACRDSWTMPMRPASRSYHMTAVSWPKAIPSCSATASVRRTSRVRRPGRHVAQQLIASVLVSCIEPRHGQPVS